MWRSLAPSSLTSKILSNRSRPKSIGVLCRCQSSTTKKGKNETLVRRMQQRIRDDSSVTKSHGWDELWKEGVTPWDLDMPTPALKAELDAMECPTNQKEKTYRILVPGCGSGFDLVTLAEHQKELQNKGLAQACVVVGLDISSTSLKRAEEVLTSSLPDYSTEGPHVILACGDFFSHLGSWKVEYSSQNHHAVELSAVDSSFQEGSFDLIYDYVFFCALPPALRSQWGEAMATLLKPGTGKLLTLMFPVYDEITTSAKMEGPPYPVSVNDYRTALEPRGVVMESQPYKSAHTIPPRSQKELVCWWRREASPHSSL